MKAKRSLQKKAMPSPTEAPVVQPENVLAEIGALYRERLRAHYNNDVDGLAKIDAQIADLRTKL